MKTLNISLPEKLATEVDGVVEEGGYASRSEFVRSLIRFYLLLEKGEEKVTFEPFEKKPIKEIKSKLTNVSHNKDFVKSVIAGLKKSSFYEN